MMHGKVLLTAMHHIHVKYFYGCLIRAALVKMKKKIKAIKTGLPKRVTFVLLWGSVLFYYMKDLGWMTFQHYY